MPRRNNPRARRTPRRRDYATTVTTEEPTPDEMARRLVASGVCTARILDWPAASRRPPNPASTPDNPERAGTA